MKSIYSYLIVLCLGFSTTLLAQEDVNTSELATVYFVRPSSLGALINFGFYDGDQIIGVLNGYKYFVYQCEPGEHLFWAKSENRSYVEANLEAGKIYLIEAQVMMGGFKAAVNLSPIDIKVDRIKAIQKLVTKRPATTFTAERLSELQKRKQEIIGRALKKYDKMKSSGKPIKELKPQMTIDESDLVFEKKKNKK